MRDTKLSPARTIGIYVFLTLLACTTVAPLFWMVSTSVKAPNAPVTDFLPGKPTMENYAKVFEKIPFGRYYVNSIFISLVITFGQMFTSALAAYAFARLEFPGRNKIFFAYLGTMMVPGAVTAVPLFMLLTKLPYGLNWLLQTTYFSDPTFFLGRWLPGMFPAGVPIGIDSYFVLIVPLLFNPYGTFLLRQFFLNIPTELDEAALIDGCSRFMIFRRIILPISAPALATLGTFTFMNSWRNFLWPLIMTNTTEMRTLPVGLASFMGEYETEWALMMAGAMMMVLPMIIVFIFAQRWFVKGIQIGAVKG